MRGKDYNVGLRGGLFEVEHYERMGAPVWLYGWLVLRQTRQERSVGLVLGGKPISYREIEEETGFQRKTLERWMRTLRREGHIETRPAASGVVVRITKAKKFPQIPARPPGGILPHAAELSPAGRLRRNEEAPPQICGVGDAVFFHSASLTSQKGSGDIERKDRQDHSGPQTSGNINRQSRERTRAAENTERTDRTTFLEVKHAEKGRDDRSGAVARSGTGDVAGAAFPGWGWRIGRDAAVRRELCVGAGPEPPRT